MPFPPVHPVVKWAASLGCAAFAIGVAAADFDLVPLPPVVLPESHFPTMTAGADLDGDGLTDLLVPGRGPEGRVRVLRNLGGGVVEINQTLEIGAQTDWAALGDLDGDGAVDAVLAIRNGPRGIALRSGLGDGTFATTGQFLGGTRELRALALADIDDDGDLDVVAVDSAAGVLRVYGNDGSGTLAEGAPTRLVPHSGGFILPSDVSAADLDADGALDLVITATGGSRIITMRNHGDGTFEPAINRRVPPVDTYQPGLINTVVIDVDGDGDLDLVSPWIMGFLTQLIGVLPNDGAATFGAPVSSNGVAGSATFHGAAADLDGDGLPEVMVGHALPGVLGVSRNLGGLAFAPPQIIQFDTFVRHVLPVDMTGNGVVDLVVVDAPEHLLYVLRNETEQVGGGLASASAAPPPTGSPPPLEARDPAVKERADAMRRELDAALGDDATHDGAAIAIWLGDRR